MYDSNGLIVFINLKYLKKKIINYLLYVACRTLWN